MKIIVSVIVVALALMATCKAEEQARQSDGQELRRAAHDGHLSKVRELIEKGVNVNAKSDDDATPLLGACQNGHIDIVKLLLDKGADINTKAKYGSTALLLSSMNGHITVVKALIEKVADVNVKAKNGWTPLMIASQNGHVRVVETLLNKGANVNAQLNNGGTALILASQNGHIAVVRLLLDKGADVNASGDYGTALMIASKKGYSDIVQLLEQGRVAKPGNPPSDNAGTERNAKPYDAEEVNEAALDSSVQWLRQMQQPFPEDAFGFGEHGITQASDKPIPFEIAQVGYDKKTKKTVLLVLSLKLKNKGKNKFGEFEFSMTEREKQENLVSARTPSGEITLYRQAKTQLSDWQRGMIGTLLKISDTRVTQEDADFLNGLK